jgi:hypothetical protein
VRQAWAASAGQMRLLGKTAHELPSQTTVRMRIEHRKVVDTTDELWRCLRGRSRFQVGLQLASFVSLYICDFPLAGNRHLQVL